MTNWSPIPNDIKGLQQELLAARARAHELEHANQQLRERVGELEQQATAAEQSNAELNRVLEETATSYENLRQEHAAAQEELAWFRRYTFGRRRERHHNGDDRQFELFDAVNATAEETEDTGDGAEPDDEVEVTGYRRRRQKREIDWDSLPQVRHDHELADEDKWCYTCDREKDVIGEDVTRELDYEPAKLFVRVHVRPKVACRCCDDGVTTVPPEPRPIPGGIAGPGLMAEVIVSKFGDHVPLYRLEDILSRHGVYFARSTLCDWVKSASGLLEPLFDLQRRLVLDSPILWTDDTKVTVLGGPDGSFKGTFWTYIGDADHPYSVYDFTKSRNRDGPALFLEAFNGYLHADAFSGYDALFLDPYSDINEVACWAHARRKFFEAAKSYPRESHQVLEWIRQLYDLEDQAREWSPEQRRELRMRAAVPVLDKIDAYLKELEHKAVPKSSLGKAVTYARNQWTALRRYTEDGRLTIDNNVSERTLRHQAIGRKNWLFLGNEEAGPRAAVLYTVLAGAKRHRIEPFAYVRDLLVRLPAGDTPLEEMLPDRWAATHPESILTYRLDESRQKAARTRERRAHRRAQSK